MAFGIIGALAGMSINTLKGYSDYSKAEKQRQKLEDETTKIRGTTQWNRDKAIGESKAVAGDLMNQWLTNKDPNKSMALRQMHVGERQFGSQAKMSFDQALGNIDTQLASIKASETSYDWADTLTDVTEGAMAGYQAGSGLGRGIEAADRLRKTDRALAMESSYLTEPSMWDSLSTFNKPTNNDVGSFFFN